MAKNWYGRSMRPGPQFPQVMTGKCVHHEEAMFRPHSFGNDEEFARGQDREYRQRYRQQERSKRQKQVSEARQKVGEEVKGMLQEHRTRLLEKDVGARDGNRRSKPVLLFFL